MLNRMAKIDVLRFSKTACLKGLSYEPYKHHRLQTSAVEHYVIEEMSRAHMHSDLTNVDLKGEYSDTEVLNLSYNSNITDVNCLSDTLKKLIIGKSTTLKYEGFSKCKNLEFLCMDNTTITNIGDLSRKLKVLKGDIDESFIRNHEFDELISFDTSSVIPLRLLGSKLIRLGTCNKLTDDDFDFLANIKELRIYNTYLPSIERLKDLEYLSIVNPTNQITDEHLSKNNKLRMLYLGKRESNYKIANLNHMSQLQYLYGNNRSLNNDSIRDCKELIHLCTMDSEITDVNHLTKLLRLDTQMDEEGFKECVNLELLTCKKGELKHFRRLDRRMSVEHI